MRSVFRGVLLFALLLPASSAWSALITYEYRGQPWDLIGITNLDEFYVVDYVTASQRFSTGFITIDSSLLPGGTILDNSFRLTGIGSPDFDDPAMIDLRFFDGVYSYPGGPAGVWDFFLETDDKGDIIAWDVTFLTGPAPTDLLLSSAFGDLITDFGRALDIRSFQPGTWTQVSEPGTFALMGLGLVGIAFLMRRRMT